MLLNWNYAVPVRNMAIFEYHINFKKLLKFFKRKIISFLWKQCRKRGAVNLDRSKYLKKRLTLLNITGKLIVTQ